MKQFVVVTVLLFGYALAVPAGSAGSNNDGAAVKPTGNIKTNIKDVATADNITKEMCESKCKCIIFFF